MAEDYTEYRVRLEFLVGTHTEDCEKAQKLIQEHINVMYHNLEKELSRISDQSSTIWQSKLEVEPT
jgi:hypothetical protein